MPTQRFLVFSGPLIGFLIMLSVMIWILARWCADAIFLILMHDYLRTLNDDQICMIHLLGSNDETINERCRITMPTTADKCQIRFQRSVSRLKRWIIVSIGLGAVVVMALILSITAGRWSAAFWRRSCSFRYTYSSIESQICLPPFKVVYCILYILWLLSRVCFCLLACFFFS